MILKKGPRSRTPVNWSKKNSVVHHQASKTQSRNKVGIQSGVQTRGVGAGVQLNPQTVLENKHEPVLPQKARKVWISGLAAKRATHPSNSKQARVLTSEVPPFGSRGGAQRRGGAVSWPAAPPRPGHGTRNEGRGLARWSFAV